jgi:hypothetical protein
MQRSLSLDEIEALIEYSRGKFEEERFPFAPALRPVREALTKVDPKSASLSPNQPNVPSLVTQRKKRR